MRRTRISRLFFIVLLAPLGSPQTAGDIKLDVVVRDRRGRVDREACGPALEVSENGEKQKIKSVWLIDGTDRVESRGRAALDPIERVRLTTLVFEKLGTEDAQFARRQALDLLKLDADPNHFYAVMMIYRQLHLLQPFTTDKDALAKGIELATSGAVSQYAAESARVKSELRKVAAQPGAGDEAAVQARLARAALDMTQYEASLDDTQGARTTINALNSLAAGGAAMPGRKTIAYFTWGIYVPEFLDVPFRAMQARANRTNTAIYTFNVGGVSRAGSTGGARGTGLEAARNTANDTFAGGPRTASAEGYDIRAAERAEGGIRTNLDAALKTMADGTGGVFVSGTNDFRNSFRQMIEDSTTYCEIAYESAVREFDGAYRKVEVSGPKDAKLRHGEGYFALPLVAGRGEILPYELPLLKALSSNPLPRNVEFHSAALRFHPGKEEVQAEVVVEVPLKAVTFAEDKQAGAYQARLSMIAQLKDAQGNLVRKFSRDLPLRGKLDTLAGLKQGNFTYKEQFAVPPGRYILETAVIDHQNGNIGARKANFVATSKPSGVSLSAVSLVRSFQPNAKELDAADPFQYQGGRVTPTLSGTVRAVKGAQLSLFFVVYPDATISDAPQLIVQYMRDGSVVGSHAAQLPAADASGRIPQVVSAPAESMPEGAYEIRVIVKQGPSAAEERAFVTVEK